MSDKITYLIVGPSGVGKTTIVNALRVVYGYSAVPSYTTRPPRYEGEEGHIFVSDAEFDQLVDMVGYTEYNGYRYCATLEQLQAHELYVIDMEGVRYMREHWPHLDNVRVIGILAPQAMRRQRMLNRGDSEAAVEQRIAHDYTAFANIADVADYLVINDNREAAANKIAVYIEEQRKCRICGCTWNNACPGGCYWVEVDLCSRCKEAAL